MLSKTTVTVSKINYYGASLRLHRHLSSNESYIQNKGSEPLIEATLGDVMLRSANKYPGRVAVRSVYEDVSLTYEELLKQADRLGCALRARGLEKGDRVGIWSHNNASWFVALLGAARAGLISVAINPVYEKSELRFSINKTGMKSLIIGDQLPNRDYYGVLRGLIPELEGSSSDGIKSAACPSLKHIITCGKQKLGGTIPISSLIADYNSNNITKYNDEVQYKEGAIIHFTSGSTGEPKAALISHYGVVNNTYFSGKRNMFNEGHQKICLQAPMFHALGSVITALGGLSHGGTMVSASATYNVKNNLNSLLAEGCTAITGTPTMYIDLLSAIKEKGEVPSKLKMALAAGAPCSPNLIKDIQTHLKVQSVMALYGLTESTASIFQSLPNDEINMVADTVGYIHDHVEVKAVDNEGKTVPFGSSGELLSRGYNNMICYWEEPEKTSKTIDRDGWLHTGDKFTIAEDGYGRIVGRLKDIIVRGGENIAPKEIEDLLNTYPDIIESQVVGVPDERLGEELCAVLRIREGSTVTAQQIASHCTGKLARYKIPRLLKFADSFPKTASGKIQKYKLADMIASGQM